MKEATKAWKVNLSKIYEGYLYSNEAVYADTRCKAKKMFLEHYEIYFDEDGKEYTFLNLPVIRAKEFDKVLYKGNLVTKQKLKYYKELEEHNNELDLFLDKKEVTHCYIKKRGLFYRPNCSGYTQYRFRTGVYTKDFAVSECKGILELSLREIDNEEHNKYIEEHISDLKSRII